MAQTVENLPSMRETWAQSLDQKESLEKEIATQYSCLENSMDRGAWWSTSPWGRKESEHYSAANTNLQSALIANCLLCRRLTSCANYIPLLLPSNSAKGTLCTYYLLTLR